MSTYQDISAVPVNRIFLQLTNPRFEPVETETAAIERLCSKENVYPLAADIVERGLNPLERFALVPIPSKGAQRRTNYFVVEGNRRLCAIKLLNDPELAPTNLKPAFKQLAARWTPVTTVPSVVFDEHDDVVVWLQRLHGGEQNGIGRRRWSAEQQQRFTGGGRNQLAQALLDHAEKQGYLTADERKGKLTTAQRFVSNQIFREALGIETTEAGKLQRTRPAEDFEKLTKTFVSDLVGGKTVTSRMNKDNIKAYSRVLSADKSLNGSRVSPEPVQTTKSAKSGKGGKTTPKPPQRPSFITHQIEIEDALTDLGVYKLQSLYHSMTVIGLDHHTPLVAIGIWSFFETLTACAGRTDGTDFCSFLSNGKLSLMNIAAGKQLAPFRGALDRVRDFGNTTKHHPISAAFNSEQINNDMDVLKDVILRLIEEAAAKKPKKK